MWKALNGKDILFVYNSQCIKWKQVQSSRATCVVNDICSANTFFPDTPSDKEYMYCFYDKALT